MTKVTYPAIVLLALAVTVAACGGEPAKTLKRDIRGFHPGTIQEFKDSAKAFNCTGVWVIPNSPAGALCEYRFDQPPYTGSIQGTVGNKTQMILSISERFTAGNPATVVGEVCKQFTTDCSSVGFDKPIDLGGGDFLLIQKSYNPDYPRAPGEPLPFMLNLINRTLVDAERNAVDPSFNKSAPKF